MSAPVWPPIVSAVGAVISSSMAAIAAWLSRSAVMEMRSSHRAEAEAREQVRLNAAYALVYRLHDSVGPTSELNDQAVKTIQHDLRALLATAVEWPLPECRALSACPPDDVPKRSARAFEEIEGFVLERLGVRSPKGKDWKKVRDSFANPSGDE